MKKSPGQLSLVVKETAAALGFDQIGITRPGNLKEGERALQEWVDEGRHGSMKYLEDFEARRASFFKEPFQPRSVIVLGINYFSHDPAKSREGLTGRIARYAWGRDYHEVIREKHAMFILRLKEMLGESFEAKSCVDIQPVPERFAAVQSGLGFAGKNTMLLSRQFGPWLFLSEIITSLELEEDLPAQGNCGTCDHCQKACPTGALDKDYTIDARRCIAYLTIEYKGIIPREYRPLIKNWIFGCDDCLTVCPFTSKSRETSWAEFRPEAGFGSALKIQDLLDIRSNADYERKFKGTALLRVGRKQMLRNACIVLGNTGKPEAIPFLEQALKDAAPLVRLHAVWALARIDNLKAVEVLKNHYSLEKDPEVLAELNIEKEWIE